MLKRTIVIANPASLHLRDNQMKILLKGDVENERSVPIEDVGIVLIENQQVNLSIPLMIALTDSNVIVVFCVCLIHSSCHYLLMLHKEKY